MDNTIASNSIFNQQRFRPLLTLPIPLSWEYTLPFVGSAPPSIYEANGKQYIVIPATGGRFFPDQPKGDAYVAFALEDE